MNDVAKTPAPVEGKMPAVKLGLTKAAIGKLKKKYPAEKVPDAGTKEGMLEIKGVLRELVPLRTGVEAKRGELVAGAVAWQKKVNAEAKVLKDEIAAIEKPYRDAKTAEEERAEKEKQEKKEAEENRIAEIEAKVADIQALAEGLLGADLPTLELRLDEAMKIKITDEEYMEFVEPASLMLGQVKQSLELAVQNGRQLAEQQEQLAQQQAEFDRQQAALKEQQDALDKQKREQEQREEQERLAKEKREREEQEQRETAEREAREARETAEREAAEKAEREKNDAYLAERLPEDIALRDWSNKVMDFAANEAPAIMDEDLGALLDVALADIATVQINVHRHLQAAAK